MSSLTEYCAEARVYRGAPNRKILCNRRWKVIDINMNPADIIRQCFLAS
jgi:hypothetical protein